MSLDYLADQPIGHQSIKHRDTHTFESQVMKKVPPKRGTGLRRCVYTNPHEHTTTNIGSCPSDENERNTHTHLRSPEKLVRTCRYGNIASCRKWRENTSNEKQKKSNTHTDTHTDTHIRTQTHTDAHRRTQTHTDRSL